MTKPTDERFWVFHCDNPRIYEIFNRFAWELVEAGVPRFGATLIYERIRWESYIQTVTSDPYKMANDYRPCYVRLWQERNPAHAERFATKTLKHPYRGQYELARITGRRDAAMQEDLI